MTGELRIGLKESLVEEAIAKAYSETLPDVQRTNMLLGDIGETLRLAASGRLSEARMRLFHPLGFMLASAVESTEEGLSYFSEAAVEDKYDGIRAQAHISGSEVKIFSRTRDEITESFPELPPAFAGLPQDVILDGEIVAWQYPESLADATVIVDEELSDVGEKKAKNLGSARPFSALQQRLGRKKGKREDDAGKSGRVSGLRHFVCGRRFVDRKVTGRARPRARLSVGSASEGSYCTGAVRSARTKLIFLRGGYRSRLGNQGKHHPGSGFLGRIAGKVGRTICCCTTTR